MSSTIIAKHKEYVLPLSRRLLQPPTGSIGYLTNYSPSLLGICVAGDTFAPYADSEERSSGLVCDASKIVHAAHLRQGVR